VLGRRRHRNTEAILVRTLLLAIAVTAALWWLLRPRRRSRRADQYAASPEPTYRAVKTFRTPGGVATTVYDIYEHGRLVATTWRCDCGVERYDGPASRHEAIRHHEAHVR
jgi:hypothetical protein